MAPTRLRRVRLGSWTLALAGILFILSPVLRPFSDETSLQGAEAFASSAWILAHLLAMVAFILTVFSLLTLYILLQETRFERLAFSALVVSGLGVGLALPFYGAEAYGLHAIGQEAIRRQDAALVALAAGVRGGAGLVIFAAGLLLLAIGAILVAVVVWEPLPAARWGGVLLALGFALFIPQFYLTQPLRVAHGILIAAGCWWIAISMSPSRLDTQAP